MKMAIKSFRPLVYFSNKGQMLGLILEIKGFQNLKLRKNVLNKNVFLKNLDNFCHRKLTLKDRFWPFLTFVSKVK